MLYIHMHYILYIFTNTHIHYIIIASELFSLARVAVRELGANPNVLSLLRSHHRPEVRILRIQQPVESGAHPDQVKKEPCEPYDDLNPNTDDLLPVRKASGCARVRLEGQRYICICMLYTHTHTHTHTHTQSHTHV